MDFCGSYRFSMSQEDQELLIRMDKNTRYGLFLETIKKSCEDANKQVNFRDQSSSKFVLSQIDKKKMKGTINSFPTDLSLNDKTLYRFTKAQLSIQAPPEDIYDPRFLVPLIYHAVSPSLFVDCRDFIAKRCLALTLVGLSSEDLQMRALCYKILERFYEHLQSALLIDKKLWINFLDLIKNSIPSANYRLKFLFTTFLARIVDVLLHPDKDKMYELVKEFLAGRPRFRIDTIEIYDDLLYCSDVEYYDNNLRWLITLFRDGLQSKNDLAVLVNLNVIPQMLRLYNSELRSNRANEAIISLFVRIVSIESGSDLLVNDHSILPWLHHVILFHLRQDTKDIKNDLKSESLVDSAKSLSSLVFALIDSLLKKKKEVDVLMRPRLLELIYVFVTLQDLVVKSKNVPTLEYYFVYVRVVAKAIRKDERFPDEIAVHLLELVKVKAPQ